MTIVQALDYFNFINFPNINVLKTKQDILMTPMCLYHKRHSSLVRPFDEQIGLYKANGLNEKWMSIYKTQSFQQKNNIGPKQLSFDQISGVLIVCSMLLGVSMIFFILELASNWCTSIKKILNFLTRWNSEEMKEQFILLVWLFSFLTITYFENIFPLYWNIFCMLKVFFT